jgi:hypothetical protein
VSVLLCYIFRDHGPSWSHYARNIRTDIKCDRNIKHKTHKTYVNCNYECIWISMYNKTASTVPLTYQEHIHYQYGMMNQVKLSYDITVHLTITSNLHQWREYGFNIVILYTQLHHTQNYDTPVQFCYCYILILILYFFIFLLNFRHQIKYELRPVPCGKKREWVMYVPVWFYAFYVLYFGHT